MSAPIRRERPKFPRGYGVPKGDDGMLEWPAIEARLVESKHYWLATSRPDGRPHLIPRWGVWLDGALYYDGAPTTRHARNLESNPACSLSLEDGQRAVIIEGTSVATRADADGLGSRLSEAFTKYHDDGYSPAADAWAGKNGGGLRVFTPKTSVAWSAFPADVTRFVF